MATHPGMTLQANASQFFDKVFESHSSSMTCSAGCAACCHTSFSLFSWEAELIISWYQSLDNTKKSALRQLWKAPQPLSLDPHGVESAPCAFLYDRQCSIYPARPIICRTQGLPMMIDGRVDSCPLNFTEGLPPKEYWLNLERLNTLSSLLQNQLSPSKDRVELSLLKSRLVTM